MSFNRCPFCESGNPADAKYCTECGVALRLAACPHCGAVSPVTASVCYQCRGPLSARTTDELDLDALKLDPLGPDALDLVSPTAEVATPLPRRPSRAFAGTAILAAIAVLGYYGYHQRPLVNAPQPPAASSEAKDRGASARAGVIRRDAAADDTKSAKADKAAGITSLATSPSGARISTPARAEASEPRAGRQPVESQEAQSNAARVAGAQAMIPGPGERAPPPEECTEAVAAVGLCTRKPVQKKEAGTTAAVAAAIRRPQETRAGKADGQQVPRAKACTAAVAALGLCTPESTRRVQ